MTSQRQQHAAHLLFTSPTIIPTESDRTRTARYCGAANRQNLFRCHGCHLDFQLSF
jgi:hypothetical protein